MTKNQLDQFVRRLLTGYSPSTTRSYAKWMTEFVDFTDLPRDRITQDDADRYIAHLVTLEYARSSINIARRAITLLMQAVDNPVSLPQRSTGGNRRFIETVDAATVGRLLGAMPVRWRVISRLCYDLVILPAVACSLEVHQYDSGALTLPHVRVEIPNTPVTTEIGLPVAVETFSRCAALHGSRYIFSHPDHPESPPTMRWLSIAIKTAREKIGATKQITPKMIQQSGIVEMIRRENVAYAHQMTGLRPSTLRRYIDAASKR